MDYYKSVDMIGTMFYGGASAIYTNLDGTYQNEAGNAYASGLAILFPTEISGTMNNGNIAKIITVQTIARGGQGVGIYCYGEFYNNFEENLWSSPKPVLGTVKTMMKTLQDVQGIIWSGIPVKQTTTGNMFMTLSEIRGISNPSQGNPVVNVLEAEDEKALGVLHFWGNSNNSGSAAMAVRTAVLDFTAKESGTCKLSLHKTDGTVEIRSIQVDNADTAVSFELKTTGSDVTYIAAEKTSGELPADKEIVGIEVLNLPDKTMYAVNEAFSSQGLKIRAQYNDGSAEVLTMTAEVQISNPDMSTAGQKEITVTYKGYQAVFSITVKNLPYETNLKDAADTADGLKNVFDKKLSTTGGFLANEEDLAFMRNGESYIQCNFDEKVILNGVKLSTNYATDQAILSLKLAVPDENGTWVFLGEEGKQQVDLVWQTNDKTVETKEVSVAPVAAHKVRLYVINAANRWTDNFGHGNHKFEMAKIEFLTGAIQ